MKRVITILLADDHRLVRRGIRTLLDVEEDMRVVAEASDGHEAVRLAEQHAPDIAVVDVAMPALSGIDVVRQLADRAPHTRVVVLSMHGSEAYVKAALRNGAYGYVLKDAEARELLLAIRRARRGEHYVCDALSARTREAAGYSDRSNDPLQSLTQREQEVLTLTVEGLTSREAGERLHISARTVEKHRANLMRKLGVRGKDELIRYVLERKWRSPGEE